MAYDPRIPVDADYLAALGRAAYNFAYLEWCVIWTGEELSAGFINEAANVTSGTIADRVIQFVDRLAEDHPAKARLSPAALSFKAQTVVRNQLLHANPYTAEGGEQRLSYSGKAGRRDWPRDDILAAAQDFETLAIESTTCFTTSSEQGGLDPGLRRSNGTNRRSFLKSRPKRDRDFFMHQ